MKKAMVEKQAQAPLGAKFGKDQSLKVAGLKKHWSNGHVATTGSNSTEEILIAGLWDENEAKRIFRNLEDFKLWLASPNIGLGGKEPIAFLNQDINQIKDLLGRLLHGVLA